MTKRHNYQATVRWTGNRGSGTSGYRDYDRDHEVRIPNKPTLLGSADSAFRGDGSRHNPEDLLVSSLSACHMLWYLHLCAVQGVVVLDYCDEAQGTLEEHAEGGGRFVEVVLRPKVTLSPKSDVELAQRLHHEAHDKCYIAASVNFPVRCEPQFSEA